VWLGTDDRKRTGLVEKICDIHPFPLTASPPNKPPYAPKDLSGMKRLLGHLNQRVPDQTSVRDLAALE